MSARLDLAWLGLCLPAAAAFQELLFPPTARSCCQGDAARPDPTITPAARASACLPSGRCRFPFGSPYNALSLQNKKKNEKTHAAPSLYHFTLNALSAPLLSFRFVFSSFEPKHSARHCLLLLFGAAAAAVAADAAAAAAFACPFCLAASHLCIRLPRDLAEECECEPRERVSGPSVCVCVRVRVPVCATLTLFVRFVPARNFIHKTCVAFAFSCLFLFRVVSAVAVRAKKRAEVAVRSPVRLPLACQQNCAKSLPLPFAAQFRCQSRSSSSSADGASL